MADGRGERIAAITPNIKLYLAGGINSLNRFGGDEGGSNSFKMRRTLPAERIDQLIKIAEMKSGDALTAPARQALSSGWECRAPKCNLLSRRERERARFITEERILTLETTFALSPSVFVECRSDYLAL